MKLIYSLLCSFLALSLNAQSIFTPISLTSIEIQNCEIQSNKAIYYEVDLNSIHSIVDDLNYREEFDLKNSTNFLSVPDENGNLQTFRVLRNKTMHPALNSLFPNIISFEGVHTTNPSIKGKFDVTPQGFHAMIYAPDKNTFFIDPISRNTPTKVMVYSKKDFFTSKQMTCDLVSFENTAEEAFTNGTPVKIPYGTCQLRTYRLALAGTAEYVTYHGSVTLAASNQVTTMNRVNGVYEREMAITMTIIANNNTLLYTNAGTDPYTNGNAGAMISENQTNINSVIGSANYDIGHVFGTNSGGLAGLGVVCSSSNKARGVTGSSNPIGDPFDIDYVAHEMGHQFKANHTQNNNCNRNNATAVEPGSASTIMGYAGICAPNVQSNSDDHFHGISLGEISTFITGVNHTCPAVTPLVNNQPIIVSTNGNVSVPANTPFALTAVVTDLDSDPISYNWEQTNNQVSTQPPVASSTTGPNFRSNPSSLSPTRYFPSLASINSGGPFTWEVIPSVTRTMNFRVSVRDNSAGPGGCSAYQDVTVSTVASAGPFVVTYPSVTGITWGTTSTQTVTWSVANTNLAPINAANVNIYLSIDGGLTFPTLLASNTANDGSENITVPGTPTTTAKIMVMSANGTFFDISDNNFTISGAPCVSPSLPVVTGPTNICGTQAATLSITGNLNDATTWQWYSGSCGGTPIGTGTTLNVLPSTTTDYFVRGTGGCVTGGACTPHTITVTNLNTNVTQTGSLLASLQPVSGTSYQWLLCSSGNAIIPGANNQTYQVTGILGSYAVEISKNGCVDTSACVVVNTAGIEDLKSGILNLSPNPASNIATLKWSNELIVETITILDAKGREVISVSDIQEEKAIIDLSSLESAMYFVQINHRNGVHVLKLMKE
ncbi:MAG: reprolysin-like metallopeptidase [Bacteroidota bacterium]